MYQHLDAALVRAPAWDARSVTPWPDLTGPDATPVAWRAWLEQAWQVPEFASAVEAASPDLARQAARIREAGNIPCAAVRRVVLSTLRYQLRGANRATPFGLLAGIAPARLGAHAVIRTGTRHRAIARADAAWLTGVIEELEADEELRPRLTVTASNLVTERDEYLVISHRSSGSANGAPERMRARATQPARAALKAARAPIQVTALAAKLAADFPAAPDDLIRGLIARMIGQRLLLTSLRAAMTTTDPLAALITELEAVLPAEDARVGGLRTVSTSLARHNSAPHAIAARGERHYATALMTSIHSVAGPVLAIDLRIDWDLTVPEAVAADAAQAAGVLARLARRPALSQGWTAWHARFLDRYGPGAVVRVLDAVDDTAGIGFPAGYLSSPDAGHESPLSDRDKALIGLAQRAVIRRDQEILLDDTLIEKLAAARPGDPVQPSAEVTVRIHAASIPDLDKGQFTLHVTGISRAAGTVAGRFLGLLGHADRERILAAYAGVRGVHQDSLLAQVSAAPLYAKAENITHAPQAARLLISLGEHPAASTTADAIAATLTSPGIIFPPSRQDDGRRSPQSLAGGAAGIALLHVERARSGHGDWATARAWLAKAASDHISAASNARLFFGAPALALIFRIAAGSTGGYQRALAALGDATLSVTRTSIASAHARMDRAERPELREFDLIRGLAGLAACHLAAHADHQVTQDTLSCLARLAEPIPGAKHDLPPWWTDASPSGELSPDYPCGHGNFGMSHGVASVLAVLSLGILRGITVPGAEDAVYRICDWTDQWRQGDRASPWWPGYITFTQAETRHVSPSLRPRPSWCYGAAGMARAQQLAGLALRDTGRQHAAQAAILAVLRDPAELGRLTEPGLCHGTAGLLQTAWRISTEAATSEIGTELPRIAARLSAQLAERQRDANPELLDGTAGAALALHTIGTGSAPEPCWDAFLALA